MKMAKYINNLTKDCEATFFSSDVSSSHYALPLFTHHLSPQDCAGKQGAAEILEIKVMHRLSLELVLL